MINKNEINTNDIDEELIETLYKNLNWQKGYEAAIQDLRTLVARFYNVDHRTVIRNVIQYLYRPIDFKNLGDHKGFPYWNDHNIDIEE